MNTSRFLYLLLLLIITSSCGNDDTSRYVIKDFRAELRPHLTAIVQNGVLGFDHTNEMWIEQNASAKELEMLTRSEHPLLRAFAFRAILNTKDTYHFDLVMNNLDDTAVIVEQQGEWGDNFVMVSDVLLNNARWEDSLQRAKTVEKVLLQHNYLRSAYIIVDKLPPVEKYYTTIRKMAQQPHWLDENNPSIRLQQFQDIEKALHALAKFKKIEDVSLIKEILLKNTWQLNYSSFALMKDSPDTSYLDILEKYYRQEFYQAFCEKGFNPDGFINTVASYKNERSAGILRSILDTKSGTINCARTMHYVEDEIAMAVAGNDCMAYADILKRVAPIIERNNRVEPVYLDIDTTVIAPPHPGVGWYY